MKKKQAPALSWFDWLLIVLVIVLVIVANVARAQTTVIGTPPIIAPDVYRSAHPQHALLAVVVGDTTAFAPDGTRYTLPAGTVIGYQESSTFVSQRVTYLNGSLGLFGNSFEAQP